MEEGEYTESDTDENVGATAAEISVQEVERESHKANELQPKNKKIIRKKSVFAYGLPKGTTAEELQEYFSSFGNVVQVKIVGEKKNCAIIQFECPVDKILQASHKIRGCSFCVKKSLSCWENYQEQQIREPKDIMASIQHCDNVEMQIENLDELISFREKDMENRYEVAKRIKKILLPYFPECQVNIFGSSVNGFGSEGADLDLLFEPFPSYFDSVGPEQDNGLQAPSVKAFKEGYVKCEELCYLSRRNIIFFITSVLKEYRGVFSVQFIPARVPIAKVIVHKLLYYRFKLSCDISCSNRMSLCNTRLLKFYSELDSRVQILGRVLRYWAKNRQLIGRESFTSYAFTLLVIYFFQLTDPPVLPSVQELMDHSNESQIINGYETAFCDDPSCFPSSANQKSVEILLQEFFHFYATFDFGHYIICPLDGELRPRSCFQDLPDGSKFETAVICIQDPLETARNVSSGVKANIFIKFRNEVSNAVENFDPEMLPDTELPWGLQQLFVHAKENVRIGKLTFDTKIEGHICGFTLDFEKKFLRSVGLRKSASFCYQTLTAALLYLLNHALLFDAVVTDRRDSSDNAFVNDTVKALHSVTRIEIAVLFNTWIERKKFKHLLKESDYYFNNEHDISLQLAQENGPLPEFGHFVCHCYFFRSEYAEHCMGLCFSCTTRHWNHKCMFDFLRNFITPSLKKMFSGIPHEVANFLRENV